MNEFEMLSEELADLARVTRSHEILIDAMADTIRSFRLEVSDAIWHQSGAPDVLCEYEARKRA